MGGSAAYIHSLCVLTNGRLYCGVNLEVSTQEPLLHSVLVQTLYITLRGLYDDLGRFRNDGDDTSRR